MKYNIIGYLIGEGFRNVLKNKKSTFACLIIMCATMLIFGIFFIIGENIDHIVKDIETSQGMEVFILDDATSEEIAKLGEEIKNIKGVNTWQYYSKEDAVQRMKERFKDKQELIKDQIYSASYVVTLTDLSLSNNVYEEISKLDNVKKITIGSDTINTLIVVGKGIRITTVVILALLILISVFIITNTIKLTVHARRKEISIMKYVGATNSFIRWPFIVEGIIIGVIAGLISLLLVGLAYNYIAEKMVESVVANTVLQMTLLGFDQMFNLLLIVYMALGAGIGIIGSSISMRKYLNV